MPSIGNRTQLNYNERMYAEKQMILDNGIPLYELRRVKPGFMSAKMHGAWDVRVWEEVDEITMQVRVRKRWYTRADSYIEYWPNKQGILTAFCPDDETWHNRIILASCMNSHEFAIWKYHNPSGPALDRATATKEIVVVRNYLHEFIVQTHHVTETNRREQVLLFSTKRSDEAEAFAREWRRKNEGKPCSVCMDKTPDIRALVKKYGVGWVTSEEFQNEHMPAIRQKVEDEVGAHKAAQAADPEDIVSQISTMGDNEKQLLAQQLFGALGLTIPKGAPPAPAPGAKVGGTGNSAGAGATAGSDAAASNLENLNWNDMRRLAADHNIQTRHRTKEDVLADLKAKFAAGQSATPSQDPKGSDQENEQPIVR